MHNVVWNNNLMARTTCNTKVLTDPASNPGGNLIRSKGRLTGFFSIKQKITSKVTCPACQLCGKLTLFRQFWLIRFGRVVLVVLIDCLQKLLLSGSNFLVQGLMPEGTLFVSFFLTLLKNGSYLVTTSIFAYHLKWYFEGKVWFRSPSRPTVMCFILRQWRDDDDEASAKRAE